MLTKGDPYCGLMPPAPTPVIRGTAPFRWLDGLGCNWRLGVYTFSYRGLDPPVYPFPCVCRPGSEFTVVLDQMGRMTCTACHTVLERPGPKPIPLRK